MSSSPAPRRLGRPPKSETESTPTRERLLDAALTLFATKGFAATSVREIAESIGIRDSGIYSHFASKQAIFDTLLREAGLLDLALLGLRQDELARMSPAAAITNLAEQITKAFDQPRARRFASVLIREGMLSQASTGRSLADAIVEVQRQLHGPMQAWIDRGLVRGDFSAEQLVWEFLVPLANVRFVYLHAQASANDRRYARQLVRNHVQFFVTCVVLEGAGEVDVESTAAAPVQGDRSTQDPTTEE
ncbi:TetR/AcrR family transcriptional regulator [Pseudonocardia sp. MH-G8]|uniref:TetR/AcrR family transcriptional regulator n=1 Tax=Pseudonocardia sp. MH-G8 TaxID=1854588 RepID=UPI000BA1624D|nr:TetR/AcrR family transcriptional regulator [Pseudonocardia sp. MH-G8]OZM83082.1 TetR family transcriptional regulator [Pseudonocardia sp. MH-G8]